MKFWNDQKIRLLIGKHKPIKKFWVHGDVFKSIFFDSASVLIPTAEEYIVNLLRRKKNDIQDEMVKKEFDLLL